jgi:diguanylate cyclase (GGDEF)-like protein/PAS domain S-box-containing protein
MDLKIMQPPLIQLLSLVPDTIIIINKKAEIIWVNHNITSLLGYFPDELLGKSIEFLVPVRFRANHESLRNSFIKNPSKRAMNDGSALWTVHKKNIEVPVFIALNYYEDLDETFIVYSIRQLSERELTTSTMNKLHERLEFSQSLAHVGTWDLDLATGAYLWTDEIYRIFGLKPQEFKATYEDFLSYVHIDDKKMVVDAVNKMLNNDTPFNGKHRVIRPSGEVRHVLEKGHVIRDESGKAIRMIGAVLDITELNQSEEKLKIVAHYDEITQLPNRVLCRQEIENRISHALFNNTKFAVLYIDLDNFKSINDTQGHLVGDDFLFEMSQKLSTFNAEGMFLARLGGDEFIIITDYGYGEEEVSNNAITLAKQLVLSTHIKKSYPNITIDVSTSIGIALYPNHGNNFTSLLSSADKAMYQVKNTGRNNYAMYHADIEQKRLRELQLISDIRTGLVMGQFTVHYQAKQCLKTEELIGCEALIRWQHPMLGNIPPLEFISLAESSRLIIPLGKFVLEQSCLFVKKWQAHSDKTLVTSVNISALQLKDPLFKEYILHAINDAGISGHNIELEITESLLMEDIEATIKTLHELKEVGVSISIDDFGTGYSSLSYLQKLPADTLKIDKSFIDSLSSSDEDTWIVKNTISLAEGLKLQTVAEGVETEEQKSILVALGCDILQGYLYSKPIPEKEFFVKFR